jgi:hypothetical protein
MVVWTRNFLSFFAMNDEVVIHLSLRSLNGSIGSCRPGLTHYVKRGSQVVSDDS